MSKVDLVEAAVESVLKEQHAYLTKVEIMKQGDLIRTAIDRLESAASNIAGAGSFSGFSEEGKMLNRLADKVTFLAMDLKDKFKERL